MLNTEREELEKSLRPLVFGSGEDTLQRVVGRLLRSQHKTLVTAESCTGGLIGKLITDVPGSSDYYICGWITYGNQAKSIS